MPPSWWDNKDFLSCDNLSMYIYTMFKRLPSPVHRLHYNLPSKIKMPSSCHETKTIQHIPYMYKFLRHVNFEDVTNTAFSQFYFQPLADFMCIPTQQHTHKWHHTLLLVLLSNHTRDQSILGLSLAGPVMLGSMGLCMHTEWIVS